jgi:hypothetical protein
MFRNRVYIGVANKRLEDGYIAKCRNGHTTTTTTHLMRLGKEPVVVCYQCYLDWIISNVPGVEIESVEEKKGNENVD